MPIIYFNFIFEMFQVNLAIPMPGLLCIRHAEDELNILYITPIWIQQKGKALILADTSIRNLRDI